jgi:enoyl-[acyl-carrier protein] reductase III
MAEPRPLAGRVAVVTGASRGIGRAIARRLAEDGADCAITYRREHAEAQRLVAEIEALGRRAHAIALDLGDPGGVAPIVARIGETFGRLDIVVASAAATAFRPMAEQRVHNVDRTFAISVDSFVALVQSALPLMPEGGGRVVAVSGIDSTQAMAGHGVLGAAKAAVESLVRTLALELGPRGVTVNGVSPGFIETDSSQLYMTSLGRDWADALAAITAMTPVRRAGTVDDVAALVAYLVSDAAGFLTGQTIVIDGGLTIVSPLSRLAEEKPRA